MNHPNHPYIREYVDYKSLKEIIRAARTAKRADQIASTEAKFLYSLDHELNKACIYILRRQQRGA